jgi:hypothetical protein
MHFSTLPFRAILIYFLKTDFPNCKNALQFYFQVLLVNVYGFLYWLSILVLSRLKTMVDSYELHSESSCRFMTLPNFKTLLFAEFDRVNFL